MGVLDGKKLAFVFPGQGSQAVGMGQSLYEAYPEAKEIFDIADSKLGFSLSRMCFDGPEEELVKTVNTQPALYTVSAAACKVAMEKGLQPIVCAGHSVGEYAACYSAGVFSFEEGLELVRRRAELMHENARSVPGAMAAILGLSPDATKEVVEKAADAGIVGAANFNSPVQTVISGEADAVKKAGEIATENGAKRVVPLKVSGGFHSPLMQDAQDALSIVLQSVEFSQPKVPVVSNFSAKPHSEPEIIKNNLVSQITGSVRWVESVEAMLDLGTEVFIELGSGSVVGGLVKKIARDATVYSAGDAESLEKLL